MVDDASARVATVGRFRSLDGLRGIAALVVVVHHVLLTQPSLAAPYFTNDVGTPRSIVWWMAATPLHLVWDGTEAVYVFYVLSGFVLALPLVSNGSFDWLAYYPRRLLRLYVPVWGAVLLTVFLIAVIDHRAVPGASQWLVAFHTRPLLAKDVLQDSLLLGKPGILDSPLWSLKWEVIFSLALPLFILVGAVKRHLWLVKIAALFALIFIGFRNNSGALSYLPMFALGTIMAFERARLTAIAERIERTVRSVGVWWVLAAISLIMLNSYWTALALFSHSSRLGDVLALGRTLEAVGAVGAVFIAAYWASCRSLFEHRKIVWLGTRSFSLYLVHEPIVVAVAFLLGAKPPLILVLLIGVPVAFLIADAFCRLVERPSHRLARRVGRLVARHEPPAVQTT
jgi:peptidoglycan/LPS O-acetylase OafA/YrhL